MIEEKHRVAALAQLATLAEMRELGLGEVYERLEREGLVAPFPAHRMGLRLSMGLRLTESGYAFLKRSLTQ